jgi:SNF2 family DNA or RNA helicase
MNKRFAELEEIEKVIVLISAVSYEPLTPSKYSKCLTALKLSTPKGTQYNGNVLKPILNDLIAKKLMIETSGYYNVYSLTQNAMQEMTLIAFKQKELPTIIKAVRDENPYKQYNSDWYPPRCFEVCARELRIAFYLKSFADFRIYYLDAFRHFEKNLNSSGILDDLFNKPFDKERLLSMSPEFQLFGCQYLIEQAHIILDDTAEYVSFMDKNAQLYEKNQPMKLMRYLYITDTLFKGNLQLALKIIGKEPDIDTATAFVGWTSLLQNNLDVSVDYFEKSLKKLKQDKGVNAFFKGPLGPFYILSLLLRKSDGDFKKAQSLLAKAIEPEYIASYKYLLGNVLFQNNQVRDGHIMLEYEPKNMLDSVIMAMSHHWMQKEMSDELLQIIEQFYTEAVKNGYFWFALEFASSLSYLSKNDASFYKGEALKWSNQTGIKSLISNVVIIEDWERTLDALTRIQSPTLKGKAAKSENNSRIAWLVDFERQIRLQPIEQTLNKNGNWSKGRNIALKRFKEGGLLGATNQDQQMASCIKQENSYWGGGVNFYFEMNRALQILVGHPYLFLEESPTTNIELNEREPELMVEEAGNDHYTIRFSEEFTESGIQVLKETPTRYYLMNIKPEHIMILNALGRKTVTVPKEGKDKLIEAINSLSGSVIIHSVVGEEADNMTVIEADSTIHAHILPIGDGFKLEMYVKPFKDVPPYLRPGHGSENVITSVGNIKMRAIRKPELEKNNVLDIISACPTLDILDNKSDDWMLDLPETCLQVLLELKPLREENKIILEWPKGEKFKITQQVGFSNLSLRIQKENDWFGLNGELKVNDNLVLSMQTLLGLVNGSKSNFIQVGDGQFIALTKALQKRLKEMDALLQHNKKGLQFSPFAASIFDDLTEGIDELEVDAAWKKQLKRLEGGKDIKPVVPDNFKAELRNYQLEGFNWLSQLAHWGVGACLADDMGLGKTIQALAVILDRSKNGPSLVVAPSSVAINWIKEVEKFAPSLNVLIFGKGDRKEAVDGLKANDLMICSYGLMQQESEMLSAPKFTTIVLDEAQAIKNYAAKRTKAAFSLQGDFKIITTGTPIENHLGELWSLFNFLNPGLLGSIGNFNERFGVPIIKDDDQFVKQYLKRMISPFVLRRKKSEVLKELPPKTEITLTVQMSDEERAFYEALRQSAVNKIAGIESEINNDGEKRLRILAEIMKLRQACCNPKLVNPKFNIASSKLELFGETVDELIENGHKALVFSQFVGHLKLIEEYVKAKGIKYQYLDGQTSIKNREIAMNKFQDGEGDLFLISLKAGGTGLNLTAADYVLHMDPWWNPAVEDQASDRAHRIGQTRPVTIYRLITENTIEDKIVTLHAMKRDLADSLLEGTDSSSKMSADELLNLIKMG